MIDEQEGQIRNIAHDSMKLEEGEGYIGSKFTSKYQFDESSEHQGIFDFIIEQEGTALNDNREVIPHHRKLTYRYTDTQFELFSDENLLASISNQEDDLDFLKCLGLKDGTGKQDLNNNIQIKQYFKLVNNPDDYSGDYYESIYKPLEEISLFGAKVKSWTAAQGFSEVMVDSDIVELSENINVVKSNINHYFNQTLVWHTHDSADDEIYTFTKSKDSLSAYLLNLKKSSSNEVIYSCQHIYVSKEAKVNMDESYKVFLQSSIDKFIKREEF